MIKVILPSLGLAVSLLAAFIAYSALASPNRNPFAMLVPEHWRWAHRRFAEFAGYFWMPCPLCRRPFGGHEWRDINGMISAAPKPGGGHTAICPACTGAGRGDRLPYITFTEGE